MQQTKPVAARARIGRAWWWVPAALTVLCLVNAPGPALAAYVCTYTATNVAFGAFTGTALTSTGTFTITCTGSGTSTTRITLSTGSSGAYAARRMTNGVNTLTYNLYTSATLASIWGDGSAGTSYVQPSNNNNVSSPGTFTNTVYASLPAQALPAPGLYQDTITATLICSNGGSCTTAATQTATFLVTVGQAQTCTVSSSDLDFGNFTAGASSAPLPGLATITANCATGTPYAIGLSEGLYPGATTSTRRMAITDSGGDASLTYGLYSDASHTINWGDNFDSTPLDVVEGTGTGVDQEIPVYGQIDGNQNVRTGLYEDTILVTLQY